MLARRKTHTLKTSAYFAKCVHPLPQAYKLLQTLQTIPTQLQTYPRLFPDIYISRLLQVGPDLSKLFYLLLPMSEQLQISPVDSYPKISRHFQTVPIFAPNMSNQLEILDKVNCCLLFTLVQTFEKHPGRFQVSAILPRLCQTFLNCLNDCQTCQTLGRLVQTSVTVSDLCPAVQTLSAFPDLFILSIFVSKCSELL